MRCFRKSRHQRMQVCLHLSLAALLGACSGDQGLNLSGDPSAEGSDAGSVRPGEMSGARHSDAGSTSSPARADASSDGHVARDAAAASDGPLSPNAAADAGRPARDAGAAPGADATTGMQDECGPVPTAAPKAAKAKAVVQYGLSEYHTKANNQFVGVRATLTVPAKPPPTGIIFVWPGTQALPDEATYQPVGGGVLQPVLTWGSSCVPGALPGHSTWWISPVYVNDETTIAELRGCHGGPVISAAVGDRLDLEMRLDKTEWYQKVVDRNSQLATEFSIDLRGQLQQRALFWIELKTAAKPTEDLIFDHIVLKMQDPEPGACALNNRGMNDYVTESRVSADGLTCCIDRIVLRAEGVAATTKDP